MELSVEHNWWLVSLSSAICLNITNRALASVSSRMQPYQIGQVEQKLGFVRTWQADITHGLHDVLYLCS